MRLWNIIFLTTKLPYPCLFSNLRSIFFDRFPRHLYGNLLSIAEVIRNIDFGNKLFVVQWWRTAHYTVKPPKLLQTHTEDVMASCNSFRHLNYTKLLISFHIIRHYNDVKETVNKGSGLRKNLHVWKIKPFERTHPLQPITEDWITSWNK